MASSSSTVAVVTALVANAFVTAIKLLAFVLSGSGAMLSEAIHSAADTGNQALLFVGLKRGAREADDRFHYGYGGERFVFGMLSATGIFFIGCGVTLYHGVSSLITPRMPQLSAVTFGVLALSMVLEGSVLLLAIRMISKQRGEMPFFRYVRERADPATVAILLEDGAAVFGLLMAAGGILAAYFTQNPMWDSLGSLVIGLLLGLVAIHLVGANRELLLGRAAPEGIKDKFTAIVQRHASVIAVRDVKTRQLTHESYKFKAEVVFDAAYLASLLDPVMPRTLAAIESPQRAVTLRRIADVAIDVLASEIKAIERAIIAEIPQATHIDLEVAHLHVGDEDEDAAEAAA